MGLLLDHELANSAPEDAYFILENNFRCGFFLGYLIKNKYDENRFKINKKWCARKIQFNTNNGPYRLYGLLKEISEENKLIKQLIQTPPQNIGEYSSLLAHNKLSCVNCFLHFSPGVYPIDNNFIHTVFGEVDIENFNCREDIPTFQRIGHTYFFALVNHNFL